MENPDLFESERDEPTTAWLAGMQPASAAGLKPDFLYRAGYEAARAEMLNKLRRHLIIGSAAVLLVALGGGSLGYRLGTQHGQVLAAHQHSANAAAPSPEQPAAMIGEALENTAPSQATTEATDASVKADQPAHSVATGADQSLASAPEQTPAISRWWQSQLRQYFVATAIDRDRVPQTEPGRTDADWDDLFESVLEGRRAVSLVTKPNAPQSPGPKPSFKETPTDSPAMRLRGSLLPWRESQMQTLMNELL